MDVGMIFFWEEPLGDFSKIFLGGAKKGGISFFPLETKKTTFFAETFEVQVRPAPTPMIAAKIVT